MVCRTVFWRDRSLITGRGLQNVREGGQVKCYPYKKAGGGEEVKVFAMLKGGHKTF